MTAAGASATAAGDDAASAELRAQQFAFAAHLRDPDGAPAPPDIEDRRLAIYRELFYNSLEGLLAGNFPVLRRLLDDALWHATVRAFYRDFRCHTPLFPEIGREFLQYLQLIFPDDGDAGDLPAWTLELAHYEWVELALEIAEQPEVLACDRDGDLVEGAPLRNTLAWPLAYRWPVHALGGDAALDVAPEQPTFLLVLRDDTGRVRFKSLSPVTFRLLQAIDADPSVSGRTHLEALAVEAGSDDVAAFVAAGSRMLDALRESGALLGTRIHAEGRK